MMPKKTDVFDHKKVTMVDYIGKTMTNATKSIELKFEKETIHSGQFMVSHFEAEEAMDDLDDSEIKMLDPEDPSLMKPDESNVCLQLQLYIPQNTTQIKQAKKSIGGVITSHLEIETSLTKLFKCMNLAYSQKLTSPKWNHFKGVRLRWKDKIRLNNVIWRCWHMQFILKRKTPVCQFASPLDVDVHSNPQSVVLEGKYWKRQLSVIKAEYRKWRRSYISKTAGLLSYDSKSDFDFLDWSPLNEKNLFPSDEWTSDILFSSINVPFPFPDPREIARGAGIADFIQPSLGPLQPNLDDIDLTFADLLQNSRLPPVPEEASDEILKNVGYEFPAIMGSDQMDDSATILEVDSTNMNNNSNDDANMIELNNSLNTGQFDNVGQQFEHRDMNYLNESTVASEIVGSDTVMTDQCIENQHSITVSTKHFGAMNDTFFNRNAHEFPGKSVIKGRISKNLQRPFRRELHNYDKAQPTPHQTIVYQQMLAEQQKHDDSQLISLNSNLKHQKQSAIQTTVYQQILAEQQKQDNSNVLSLNTNMQQQRPSLFHDPLQMQYTTTQNVQQGSQIVTNSRPSNSDNTQSAGIVNTNSLYIPSNNSNICLKKFELPEYQTSLSTQKLPTLYPTLNIKNLEPSSSETHIKSSYEFYGVEINSSKNHGPKLYKPIQLKTKCTAVDVKEQSKSHSQIKINSQPFPVSLNSLYPNSLSPSLPTSSQQKLHQKTKVETQKEMFRSNSLPLNVSLNRINHDSFVAPKYQIKNNKSRSRSNSIHHVISNNLGNFIPTPIQVQPATSDPMLQTTLTQLLTKTPKNLIGKQSRCSDNITSKLSVSLFGSEFEKSKESVGTLKSITGMISIPGNNQQSSEPKLHQSLTKSQLEADIPAHNSSPTVILYNTRENKAKSSSFSYEKNPGNLSESLSNQNMIMLPEQNRTISTENQRRVGHIHAEQKRRYNIKNGFDMLYSLIPHLQQNSSSKLSKAAMLQKGVEHIKFLRTENRVLDETIKKLQQERDALNNSLSHLQTILPVSGAPLSRQGSEHVMQLYEHYVRFRTLSNWKFWILGLIMEPLLTTFTSSVSNSCLEEMRRTAYLWIDQHCSLIDLRPAVSNKLKFLSMTTDILSNPPSALHEEVKKAISLPSVQHLNLDG